MSDSSAKLNEKIINLVAKVKQKEREREHFGMLAMDEFCLSIDEIVVGIVSHLEENFSIFYNDISCTITSTQLQNITVTTKQTLPNDISEIFNKLKLPLNIDLNFSLARSTHYPFLANQSRTLKINFRELEYEFAYFEGVEKRITYVKDYFTHLEPNEIINVRDIISEIVFHDIQQHLDKD